MRLKLSPSLLALISNRNQPLQRGSLVVAKGLLIRGIGPFVPFLRPNLNIPQPFLPPFGLSCEEIIHCCTAPRQKEKDHN